MGDEKKSSHPHERNPGTAVFFTHRFYHKEFAFLK
jgi:hypothetical protein